MLLADAVFSLPVACFGPPLATFSPSTTYQATAPFLPFFTNMQICGTLIESLPMPQLQHHDQIPNPDKDRS
jgi:hypothetical protein